MKKLTTVLAIVILLLTQSCNKNEQRLCFTPPSPFEFELVDKSTGENLFTNGTFSSDDIKVINLADQSYVSFKFIDEDDYNILVISTIGWQTEIVNYSVQISSENIFDLYVNAERLGGEDKEDCDYTECKEVRIENSEYELNQSTDIYKILVDIDFN